MTKNPEYVLPQEGLNGGEFLIKESQAKDTFIPEDLNEEQLMTRQMIEEFLNSEVYPHNEKIEKQEDNIAAKILKQAAEMGLLGTHMPEEYGGMAMDTNTNTVIVEAFGPSGSFGTTFAAHTGIGMLPILYFGTEAQKQKYLPGLISGELAASYCLTEPSSGSDALAAKTRADLSADGKHYILNGQKMWISNAGFADVFVVFAQIDGNKFTGFIVDRDSEGMTLGAEEKKLGIKGSSTRQVFFENVKVPVENLLGTEGKGHLIAFNVLNVGRFKLGAMAVGGAKYSFKLGVNYANERIQFKQPIANFGAIKHKIGESAIQLFANEAASYRISNLLHGKITSLKADGLDEIAAKLKSAEEYAIECSILKVTGSESATYIIDEALQIHGGMGFSEESRIAQGYRDIRISRIYEGTNEINRMLMVDMLFKRALKGNLDIATPAMALQKELMSPPSKEVPTGAYGKERQALANFKKATLMIAGSVAQLQMGGQLNLKEEQEILMNIADMMMDVYLAESTLLRVEKLADRDTTIDQAVYDAILKVYFTDAKARIYKNGTDALISCMEGDMLKGLLMGLRRFTKYIPTNVKRDRRLIADVCIKANEYCF